MVLRVIGSPNIIRRLQAPVVMRMLEPIRKEDLILDAGCGGGFFMSELAKMCCYVGTDINFSSSVTKAAMDIPSSAVSYSDLHQIPFKSGVFDKVLLSSVLQMVGDDERVLAELKRILKRDGILVLSVPLDYIYVRKLNEIKPELIKTFGSVGKGFYNTHELSLLLERAGFKILDVEYSPKRIGSLIYELCIYLCYITRLPLFHPLSFLILYPFAWFDHFDGKKQSGCEIVIKAQNSGL